MRADGAAGDVVGRVEMGEGITEGFVGGGSETSLIHGVT